MQEPRPPLDNYEQLARMVDYLLLRPDLGEERVVEGCRLALDRGIASVTVRPSDADLAVNLLRGSQTLPGSVVGYPHGFQTTPVKLYEARDLLRRGVREIALALNTGKMISRQFQYAESELTQMAEACRQEEATLKVLIPALLAEDLKVVACRLCKRAGVDYAVAFASDPQAGVSADDIRLLAIHCGARVRVSAAGGLNSLEQVLAAYEAGGERFGAEAPVAILDSWRSELARRAEPAGSRPS